MKLIRVGVDLAKNVFQVHGVDRNETAVWRRKLTRENWLKVLLETVEPGCEIGMESCGGAHHWARCLLAHGFKVRLVAPQFVKPYVKSNKNDANDAEAICEAISRPHMRFVSMKTVEQQDIQAVHRIRAELTKQRTAKANQILLLALDQRGVTFRWKDYRTTGKACHKTMTLDADEFMRRFLLHVLPGGFHRIQHYGLLANAGRREHLARARELLHVVPATTESPLPETPIANIQPTFVCPHCGAAMIVVETFARGQPIRAPPTLRVAA